MVSIILYLNHITVFREISCQYSVTIYIRPRNVFNTGRFSLFKSSIQNNFISTSISLIIFSVDAPLIHFTYLKKTNNTVTYIYI